MTNSPTPVETAFALLREGRFGDAEHLMTRELAAVTQAHGEGSRQWASTQCDLGNVLLNTDQLDRAITAFQRAAAAPAADHDARKDQLTYRMNVGLALRMAGRLDEAEAELRQGVRERLAFYGHEHAGYAFGLEPLADLLRQRGNLAEARQIVDEAIANLWHNGHERLTSALALRAAIVHAAGTGEPPFAGLDRLPDGFVAGVGRAVLQQLDSSAAPQLTASLLTALVTALDERLGPDHQATLDALSAVANVSRDAGDPAGRVDAIRRVLASYDRQGRPEEALMAELGLAMAHGEAGDPEAGLRAYASAHARAQRTGRAELVSQVLRNWGLALREAGRPDEAESRLREALTEAERGADHDTAGRAAVALGLLLQHAERLAEARPILERGLAVMDPVHPDAIVGRSHLGAVLDGRGCGCGDMPSTIADAFRTFVLTRLPADLLDHLDVAIVDGDFKISVALRREPAPEELNRLNEVFNTALAEFRSRLTAPGYAS